MGTAEPGPGTPVEEARVVIAAGVLLGLLSALFLGLAASTAWPRRGEARGRRRRRARRLLAALEATAAAGTTRQEHGILALGRELRELLAGAERVADGASPPGLDALRAGVAAELGRRADAWHGSRFRRRRLRRELLAGVALLEQLPAEENLPVVVRLLHLPDALVVACTASALARQPAVYSGAIVSLAAVLRVTEPLSRPHVEQALRSLVTAHPEMMPLLASDPSPLVRRNVVKAAGLASGGSQPAVDPALKEDLAELLVAGTRDPEADVRLVTCRALERAPSPRRLSELGRLLYDDDDRVRVAATRSLRAVGDPRAVPLLAARLKGAAPALTREVLRALAELPRTENQALVSALTSEGAERVAALRALGALGGEAEAFKIVQLIEDPNPRVRLEASLALAAIGRLPSLPLRGTVVVERLGQQLALERNDRVAAGLAEALASSGDPRSTEPLIARIKDSSPVLREQLVEGLALLNLLMTAGSPAPQTI